MEFIQYFLYPSVNGILLALVFGLIWMAALGVWRWQGKWLWLCLAGIIIFPVSIGIFQTPLQNLISNAFVNNYGVQLYIERIFLMGLPVVLVSGFIQEGAKMLPAVMWWWGHNKELTPRTGLAIGAVVGAVFGVVEAQWILNQLFASGYTWSLIPQYGFEAVLPLWERFFTVAFHIGTGAITGYGLAKGKGWQFYLIASGIHSLTNYTTLFYIKQMLTTVQIEIVIAVISVIVFGVIAWLAWRIKPETPAAEPTAASGTSPSEPASSGTSL